ncbi:MAG TPA: hypothetical protein VF662_03855 [Allosphingosinicella sp.]
MTAVEIAENGPMECSPETPWGLHPAVLDNICPRCGWTARGLPGGDAEALSTG